MKRVLMVLLATGVAATWLGCQQAPSSSTAQSSGTSSTDSEAGNYTLVNLSVPNMTWGGCAASVRGDLEKIDGIVDITTNIADQTCSFKLTKPDVNYETALAEFAKTNEHLAGYTIK